MLTLSDVVEALTGVRPPRGQEVLIETVVDSRQAIPGAMFVALPGESRDGHEFVADAFARGATVALVSRPVAGCPVVDLRGGFVPQAWKAFRTPGCLQVEDPLAALQAVARFWRRKMAQVRVVGITGSVGKSTTKELAAQVLSRRYRTLRNMGNFNNEIGLPLTLLRLTEGYQRAVLEMGFYVPGDIALLCDLAQPQVGVVTNVGLVHAERAGSQEIIARGKAELVEALPPAEEGGVAVLNYDDPWVRAMAEKTRAQVFFYGLSRQADLWADEIEGLGLDGIRLRLHYRGETLTIKVPLLGRHSAHTVLRATAVGLAEGLNWGEIVAGLRMGHTQLRLVAVRAESGALLLDDTYNASPQSTLAALNLLADLPGRRVAVLGDMLELGPYEQEGHWKVGLRAAEVASLLVTVGERARMIAEAARQGGLPPSRVLETADAAEAVAVLRDVLRPDDVVLIKGSRGVRMDGIVSALEAAE